jgi:hypothetical protein
MPDRSPPAVKPGEMFVACEGQARVGRSALLLGFCNHPGVSRGGVATMGPI